MDEETSTGTNTGREDQEEKWLAMQEHREREDRIRDMRRWRKEQFKK